MSHKNGDRARFDRQKKAKLQNRQRMRALRKSLAAAKTKS
jgi:hypothetical protein